MSFSIMDSYDTQDKLNGNSQYYHFKRLADTHYKVQPLVRQFVSRIKETSNISEEGDFVHGMYSKFYGSVSTLREFRKIVPTNGELFEYSIRYLNETNYDIVMNKFMQQNCDDDISMCSFLKILNQNNHVTKFIPENIAFITDLKYFESLDSCRLSLRRCFIYKCPLQKLNSLVTSCKGIFEFLKGVTNESGISADDFVPTLIYLLASGNVSALQCNIEYIQVMSTQESLQSGESAYFFTNLLAAHSFLKHLNFTHLSMSQCDFDKLLDLSIPKYIQEWKKFEVKIRQLEDERQKILNLLLDVLDKS